jgi:uncharacterized protein (TIGR00255 family)
MIRSMTGYSKVRGDEEGFALSVSVKSINHRFLDLQVRLPASLESLEPAIRRLVKERVPRGHVEVTVSMERSAPGGLKLDEGLVAAYAAACHKLRAQYGFSPHPDPVALLRIPGMVVASNGELPPDEFGQVQRKLEGLMGAALARLNEMRVEEGEALEHDMRRRLKRLSDLAEGIQGLARRVPQLYQRRLENRVKEMLGNLEMDQARVSQEVAFLASRSDVTEELTRFRSHLDQANHLLMEGVDVGKKLDFLLQEMNREANTLLSKTTDVPEVGVEISKQAIELKTEVEKLREQAQNIE